MASSGVKQVAWASVGVLAQGLGRLGTNVLVGRVGGAATLGTMATVQAVAQVLVTLGPGSLGSTGVKFVAQARARGDDATVTRLHQHLVLRSLQSCLALGLVGAIAWALIGGSPAECIATAVLVLALGSYNLVQGLLYARRRTRKGSLRDTAAAALSLGTVAAVLAWHPRTQGGWLALPLALALLLYAAAGYPRLRPRSLGGEGRQLDLFTLTSALGSLSSAGFIQLSVVAASTVGRASAGQFAVALALCTPLTLVVTPLGLALFPAVNDAVGRGDTAGVRRQITVATHFLAYALLAGGGLMVIIREPVISLVWGRAFAPAGDVFVPLVVATSLSAVALPATNGMTSVAQRYATRATAISVTTSVVGVCSWFVLVPQLQAVGVAVGLLVGRATYAAAVLESARRLHGMPSWARLAARAAVVVVAIGVLETAVPWISVRIVVFALLVLAVVASDAPMRAFARAQFAKPAPA